ncbi:MAG: iron ABC transporter permease [Firmicutes bacterium]|nr:iron ABC transporter permease [Bacillota bacterium]
MPTSPLATDLSSTTHGRRLSGGVARAGLLLLATGALALTALLSLRVGSVAVSSRDVLGALFAYAPESYEQTVVRALRLPRTIVGAGVGAALALAGAGMQAATRNPLAEPALLGVNSGAAFAIVTAVYLGHLAHPLQHIWFGFLGGLGSAALVYAIGSAGPGGATPVKLALAGMVVSALLGSWTTALLLLDQQALEVVRFWLVGSLAGRDLGVFRAVSPFLLAGIGGMLLLGRHLTVLSLGEEAARSLGMHTGRVRALVVGLVALMTGAAVAAAGPIGFVGLAVPHMVRGLVGPDYRWVLPLCLVTGPLVLLGADILGRVLARPGELPVGIVTALLGAPFLIALARRRRGVEP